MNFLDLDPKLQKELIEAFSKRFTNTISRGRLLNKARIPWPKQTENSWENIFFCLANNPILLKKLLHTAIQTRPDDQNLRDIVALLAPNPTFHRSLGQSIAILAGAVCALFAYAQFDQNVGKLLSLKSPDTETELAQIQKETPLKPFSMAVARETKEVQIGTESAAPILKPKTHIPSSADTQKTFTSTQNTKRSKTESSKTMLPKTPESKSTKRCRIEGNGELIGYWYAGSTPPEAKDGWITMRNGINVRLDYPDEHNGYNSRAPITCVLFRNSKVPMNKPAIHVPGNKYWIPLYSSPQG